MAASDTNVCSHVGRTRLGLGTSGRGRYRGGVLRAAGRRVLVLAALGAALLSPSPAGAHTSVIGGSAAARDDAPWAAEVEAPVTPTLGSSCSGSVIAPGYVLTAAHCVEDVSSGALYAPEGIRVATGSVLRSAAKEVLAVRAVHVDPDFDRHTLFADAALLELASPTDAPPIPLASSTLDASLSAGTPALVAGWGITDAAATVEPDLLQTGTMALQSDAWCASALAPYRLFDVASMRCAAVPGFSVRVCHGDSGGPLVVSTLAGDDFLVGITSWSDAACGLVASVFTRVAAIAPWVNAVVNGAAAPPHLVPSTAPAAAAPTTPQAPRVRAQASRGRWGRRANLFFTARASAPVRASVAVRTAAGRRVGSLRTAYANVGAGGSYYVRWTVPRRVGSRLRFCVGLEDRAGRRSAPSCAPLAVRG
jgi:secreted trypsin-like serine protease